jgi:four helix bundle protein
MKNFKKLKVWQKAHQLALRVYEATRRFPREEVFCLTLQVRRSATSIPSHLAEGCGRNTAADFAKFLQVAMGSACELEYQLILARDLGYLSPELHPKFEADVSEVKRMLAAFLLRVCSTAY